MLIVTIGWQMRQDTCPCGAQGEQHGQVLQCLLSPLSAR